MKEITVNEFTENQTLLLKIHLDGQGHFYKCSRLDPKAAYE
jgi:hypothetical protein